MSQPSNLVLQYLIIQIGMATPISKLQVAERRYQATMMSGEAPNIGWHINIHYVKKIFYIHIKCGICSKNSGLRGVAFLSSYEHRFWFLWTPKHYGNTKITADRNVRLKVGLDKTSWLRNTPYLNYHIWKLKKSKTDLWEKAEGKIHFVSLPNGAGS